MKTTRNKITWDQIVVALIFVLMSISFIFLTILERKNAPLFCDDKIQEIISLDRSQETSWSFILWIDTNTVYYAYEEVSNSRFKLLTLPQVDIFENELPPAYVREYKLVEEFFWLTWYCDIKDEYIQVPKWTIIRQFNP